MTNATNISSYVQKYNAGIAIADENVDELQSAFKTLHTQWKNSDLEIMSQNAKKLVLEAFDWNTLVNQLDELYT